MSKVVFIPLFIHHHVLKFYHTNDNFFYDFVNEQYQCKYLYHFWSFLQLNFEFFSKTT